MDKKQLLTTAVIVTGKTIIETPNDAELGEKVRQLLYESGEIKFENNKIKDDASSKVY
jgi:hypothetical protein